MYIIIAIVICLALATIYVLNLPVFGKVPEGQRLERIKKLKNYKNGALDNISPTPVKPDNVSYWDMLRGVLKKNIHRTPSKSLPHITPDFTHLANTKITWFGHSSYLIQTDGLNILVDPVFSKRTSPLAFIGTSNYKGTDFITPEQLPDLDVIVISHDHYDHLDYPTILKLKDRTKRFVTSLGVGAHLEHWGSQQRRLQSWHGMRKYCFKTD